MKNVDVDALFIGPKSENRDYFKEMMNFLVDEHLFWRRDFHPNDPEYIKIRERYSEDFMLTQERMTETLHELSSRLKESSMPWASPRYLGHMNSDTLAVANLAYLTTILYNPNNVAYEASPVTTALEIEAGKQLAGMLGYDPGKSWGHITCDGTVANYEALWLARNIKTIPLAIKEVKPERVDGKSEWELLNIPVGECLDMLDVLKKEGLFEAVKDRSVRVTGVDRNTCGKFLVPQSKHYSWVKAADIFGIGQENMVPIQVDEHFRMDLKHLKQVIDGFVADKIPIMGVVAVVGTTEEGAVDHVDLIAEMLEEYERDDVSWYFHIDAAYGGYARSIFLDKDGIFMEYDELIKSLHSEKLVHRDINWPKLPVYSAFRAIPKSNSVTIDPHKMGYVPYAAGAIVIRDKRILDLISYFAAYVFEKEQDNPMLLGSYILEGSKPGATAAAVWASHKAVPLNVSGYGRIIARSVEGAARLYHSIKKMGEFEIEGIPFCIHPLVRPDFNIVMFAFNEADNTNLERMNDLNRKIYEKCSYVSGPVYQDDFITSKTSLDAETYGEAPLPFIEQFGMSKDEWERVKTVYLLRSCVLTPYLARTSTYVEYWGRLIDSMKKIITEISLEEAAQVI